MSGEAAEEFVRIMLNGTEVLVRLTGSAARSLASLLIEWNRNHQSALPDSPLYRLLRSGEPLQVVSIPQPDYARFKEAVDSQFPYAPFQNALSSEKTVDVVLPESSLPFVTRILKEIGTKEKESEQNKEDSKKKDSPSRRFSGDVKDRSAPETASGTSSPMPAQERESVLKRLDANRDLLRSVGSSPERNRRRQRTPGKSR